MHARPRCRRIVPFTAPDKRNSGEAIVSASHAELEKSEPGRWGRLSSKLETEASPQSQPSTTEGEPCRIASLGSSHGGDRPRDQPTERRCGEGIVWMTSRTVGVFYCRKSVKSHKIQIGSVDIGTERQDMRRTRVDEIPSQGGCSANRMSPKIAGRLGGSLT